MTSSMGILESWDFKMTEVKEGYKKTEVGVIPVEWEIVELNSILEQILDFRGKTPKKIGLEWGDGTIKALSANNVKMGYIDFTRECNYASNELYEKWMNKGGTKQNDIVLTMEAPLGKVALIPDDEKYILSQRVVLLKTKSSRVNNLYLYQYLSSTIFQGLLDKNSTGTTAKGIKQTRLKTLSTILPPLKEQEKIANILSTADEKIDAIDLQIQKAETLKKGLLQKLLSEGIGHREFKDSELGKIPVVWEVKKVVDTDLSIIDGDRGNNYPKSDDFSEDGFCLFLSAKNITKNGFRLDEKQFISEDKDNLLRKGKLKDLDIVITTRGSVGHIAYNQNIPYKHMRINSGMVILRNDKNTIDQKYLYILFASRVIQKQIETIAFGSAQPQLTVKGINNLKVPLPPIKEQKQIADILSTADNKLEALRAKKEKYETLKKGLLQKLLSGEVRVKV